MRPIRQDTDSSQYNDLLTRLKRLEQRSSKPFDLVAASSIDLGSVDGDNITGVRLFGHVTVAGISGASFLRIRPNGLSVMPQNAIGEEVSLGTGPSYTTSGVAGLYSGGVFAGGTGLAIADLRAFTAAALDITFHGFFSTHTGVRRIYQGMSTTVDLTTDSNRMSQDVLSGRWNDTTTVVESLLMSADSGTLTGRVTMQIV